MNLNGAEEIGLLGAASFLKHRWAKDVRVYVYVEALPGGVTTLLGAGPGNPWLARTYARAVARPFGNVIGQDLMRAGWLPHNGDFTPFHEAGLVGLDLAMTGDGWAYHTMLDRTGRLQPGSLQHLGDSVLAVTRALASGPLPADQRDESVVFYDLLGLTMVTHSGSTARLLAALALGFAAAALVRAGRRSVSWRLAAGAFGWTVAAVACGLLAATAGAAFVSFGLGRSSGWFSAPPLAVIAYGAPAAAASLAIHALWRRRGLARVDPQAQAHAALMGGLIFWSALLALLTAKEIGAGYIALYWTVGGALALFFHGAAPSASLVVTLACLTPALLMTCQVAVAFLSYFIPITGLLGLPAVDVMIGALVGVPVITAGVLLLAVMHRIGGLGRAAVVLSAVGALGLAMVAVRFPYTQARPKRITVSHVAEGDAGSVRIKGSSPVGMTAIRLALPEAAPVAGQRATLALPAPPPRMAVPRAVVEAEQRGGAAGERTVTLRIYGTSPSIRLRIPSEALRSWSLAPSLAATRTMGGYHVAQLWDLDPAGQSVTLTLHGDDPVEIELRGTAAPGGPGTEVEAVLKALPTWVTVSVNASRTIRMKI